MLEKELEVAVDLARRAGGIILDFYAKGFEVEEKIQADTFSEPVTIADRTASKIICEGLFENFPDDGILSEEETDDLERLSKKRAWIIDPLDGTQGFVDGNNDFAVQIGLSEAGAPVLGVVFLPTENCLYYAARGAGAYSIENDGEPQRLQVSDETDFATMNLAVSRSHRSSKMSRVSESFGFKREVGRGSVGLKIGLIAERKCDLYIHLSPRTKHWDTCAPEIILKEAGGEMTDLFGRRIVYNTRNVHNYNGVLASNGAAHAAAVGRMKLLLSEFGRARVKAVK